MPEKNQPHQFSRIAEDLVADLRGIGSEDPKRSRKRPTQALNAVMDQLLQKYQIGRSTPEQTIREQWADLVGGANAAYSHALAIERNRLTVLVSHGVVRNELFMHKEEIVARIQKLPGCADVKSLNLRSG